MRRRVLQSWEEVLLFRALGVQIYDSSLSSTKLQEITWKHWEKQKSAMDIMPTWISRGDFYVLVE